MGAEIQESRSGLKKGWFRYPLVIWLIYTVYNGYMVTVICGDYMVNDG
jgi:hypothetical protein